MWTHHPQAHWAIEYCGVWDTTWVQYNNGCITFSSALTNLIWMVLSLVHHKSKHFGLAEIHLNILVKLVLKTTSIHCHTSAIQQCSVLLAAHMHTIIHPGLAEFMSLWSMFMAASDIPLIPRLVNSIIEFAEEKCSGDYHLWLHASSHDHTSTIKFNTNPAMC